MDVEREVEMVRGGEQRWTGSGRGTEGEVEGGESKEGGEERSKRGMIKVKSKEMECGQNTRQGEGKGDEEKEGG